MVGITNIPEIKEVIDIYYSSISEINIQLNKERRRKNPNKQVIASLNGRKSGIYRRMRREVRVLIVKDITAGGNYSIFSVQKMYGYLFGITMNRTYLHKNFNFNLPAGAGRAMDKISISPEQEKDISRIMKMI